MKLRKCTNPECQTYEKKEAYTLKNTCPKCSKKTSEAHYKYVKIKEKPDPDKNQ